MNTELINKELERLFDLVPENIEPSSSMIPYISKMEDIFKKRIFEINLSLKDNKLVHEGFKPYERGASQTWFCIFKALYFFGIIEDSKYDEDALLKTIIKLNIVTKYKTFNEYLNSTEAKKRILKNYHNSKNHQWFQARVFTSIWIHEGGKYGNSDFILKIYKNLKGVYKGMYEALATIFAKDLFKPNFNDSNLINPRERENREVNIISEKESEITIHKAMKKVMGNNITNLIDDYIDENISESFFEGKIKESFVKVRKRNSRLRELALKDKPSICKACGLDMKAKYGDLAVPHVHHRVPLYTLDAEKQLSVDDVIVLCPSCHAAIHKRRDPFITVDEFMDKLNNHSKFNK